MDTVITKDQLESLITQDGINVAEISQRKGVLLVFLRHFGCIFCKETLYDLENISSTLKENNIEIVLVHMADYKDADERLKQSKLYPILNISDPSCKHYHEFGLHKGSLKEIFGFQAFVGGTRAFLSGARFSTITNEDKYQMPGLFFIKDEKVINQYNYNSIGEAPNYLKILNLD